MLQNRPVVEDSHSLTSSNQHERLKGGAAAATVAASRLGLLGCAERSKAMTEVAQQTDSDKTAIRPFHVNVPEAERTDRPYSIA